MSYRFTARHITFQEDDGILTVAFADDRTLPTKYLIIQTEYAYDEQDEKLGIDEVYVEIEGQSRSSYGGILSISYDKMKLLIEFDETSATRLRVDHFVNIKIDINDDSIEKILKKLKIISEERGIIFRSG